jgi:hypothetical protein
MNFELPTLSCHLASFSSSSSPTFVALFNKKNKAMSIFTTTIPIWVSILFLFVFPITVLMISNVAKQAALKANLGNQKATTLQWGIIIFFSIYLLYAAVLSINGVFAENTLPPKVLLYTMLPLLIFLFGYVFNTKLYWKLLENTSLSSLIRLHIFRLVGIIFIIAYLYEALPARFALIAGIGDIATAIFCIPVAKWITEKKPWGITAAYIWNIFGFWDIVSVLVTAILTTKDSIENHTQSIAEIAKFPFAWIPAFAPAVIVFLHITVFKKLKIIENIKE